MWFVNILNKEAELLRCYVKKKTIFLFATDNAGQIFSRIVTYTGESADGKLVLCIKPVSDKCRMPLRMTKRVRRHLPKLSVWQGLNLARTITNGPVDLYFAILRWDYFQFNNIVIRLFGGLPWLFLVERARLAPSLLFIFIFYSVDWWTKSWHTRCQPSRRPIDITTWKPLPTLIHNLELLIV